MPDRLPDMSTHRADEDDCERDLKVSVKPGGHTKSLPRVKAVSGESEAANILYIDHIACSNDPEAPNAKTAVLEAIEDERAHLDSATTIEPRLTISGNRASAARHGDTFISKDYDTLV